MAAQHNSAPKAPTSAPPTKPTGQRRSLERGKSTRKKNAGKRAKQGG
jgi:hypothetical protein